jgi:hypothetical protein
VHAIANERLNESLQAGAQRTIIFDMQLPEDVDPSGLDIVVMADQVATDVAGQRSLRTQAVIGCPETRPTPIPTRYVSPTPTPVVTPSPTPTPSPIYLPIAYASRWCISRSVPGDVMLVVDLSTSMLQQVPDGRTRMTVVEEALSRLVRKIHLDPEPPPEGRHPRILSHDQVAVIGFNARAWTELPLESSRPAILAALGRLPARASQFSRLDLGLDAALEAATGPARRADSRRLVVLLTDGLANPVPAAEDGRWETTVLRAADRLRSEGVELHVLGVGADLNDPLLTAIADPGLYVPAQDTETLELTLERLARTMGCQPSLLPPPR